MSEHLSELNAVRMSLDGLQPDEVDPLKALAKQLYDAMIMDDDRTVELLGKQEIKNGYTLKVCLQEIRIQFDRAKSTGDIATLRSLLEWYDVCHFFPYIYKTLESALESRKVDVVHVLVVHAPDFMQRQGRKSRDEVLSRFLGERALMQQLISEGHEPAIREWLHYLSPNNQVIVSGILDDLSGHS